jgi:eukaryotic-like serine/threonine-protein kinase
LMAVNPSYHKGPRKPVDSVSLQDSKEFCRKLGQICGKTGRLPTESEWEYACRAGTTTRYSFGDGTFEQRQPRDDRSLISGGFYGNIVDIISEYAWYDRNLGHTVDYHGDPETTFPVGQKKPNAWGLYDMHGNIWERCLDWYGIYPSTPRD